MSQKKPFLGRSHFRGEAIFVEKQISDEKPFSKKLSLPSLVKNVPSHFRNKEVSKST